MEFLARAQADVLDGDVLARGEPGEFDHVSGQVGDLDGRAHFQQIDLGVGLQGGGP